MVTRTISVLYEEATRKVFIATLNKDKNGFLVTFDGCKHTSECSLDTLNGQMTCLDCFRKSIQNEDTKST